MTFCIFSIGKIGFFIKKPDFFCLFACFPTRRRKIHLSFSSISFFWVYLYGIFWRKVIFIYLYGMVVFRIDVRQYNLTTSCVLGNSVIY